MDFPSGRERGEDAVAVVAAEARGAVGAEIRLEQVAVFVGVVDTSEVGAQAPAVFGRARRSRKRFVGSQVVQRPVRGSLLAHAPAPGPVFHGRIAEQHAEVVVADGGRVAGEDLRGEVVVPRGGVRNPGVREVGTGIARVGGVVPVAVFAAVGVPFAEGRGVVHRGLDAHALVRADRGVDRAVDAGGVVVAARAVHHSEDVVGVRRLLGGQGGTAPGVDGTGIDARGGLVQGVEGSRDVGQPVFLALSEQPDACREPLRDVRFEVGAEVHLLGRGVDAEPPHDTLIVEVAQREQVADLLRPARDREVVLLGVAVLENLVKPVGVGVEREVRDAVFTDPVGIGRLLPPEVDVRLGEDARGPDVVARLVDKLHVPGVIRNEVQVVVGHLQDALVGVADLGLPGRTVFRGDEDDAVGGARSVDRGRGGVLEHRDRCDVVRVHVVHAPFHAVNEHQRAVGAGGERAVAADTDRRVVRTGLAGTLRDVHTGRQARQRCRGADDGAALAGLREVDRRDGARQVDLLLDAVAYHHDVFEQLVVRLQRDVDDGAARRVFRTGPVAHAGEPENRVGALDGQRVPAFGIGRRGFALGGHDDRADDRRPLTVGHLSRNGAGAAASGRLGDRRDRKGNEKHRTK